MEQHLGHPTVEDFDALLVEMREMDDRSKPILQLQFDDSPSESELMEMFDRSREFANSAQETAETAILQQIARVRVLAQKLKVRALLLGMFRDDDDRGGDDGDHLPLKPSGPSAIRDSFPVLAV